MEALELLRTTQERNAQKHTGASSQSARFAILSIAPHLEQIVMSLPDFADDAATQPMQDENGDLLWSAGMDTWESWPGTGV